MSINLKIPDIRELKPRITVFGVGGAGGNAVNNMISAGLQGVDFVVANTDAQALTTSRAERIIQMGVQATEGLGAGSQPDVGRAAAEEVIDEIRDHLTGAHMVFVTAGMGGGTGTGASPVVARAARELGILTVGVVTKPFHFEGQRRMRMAESGIAELQKSVDTLIIIPNQNLFRVANEKTTFADAFAMADQVLYSGVACITDLMVKEGLINLDFADVRAVMREMGKAMMGTGEASGDKRALRSAEAAICNPLIDDVSMRGARGLLDLDHRRQGPHPLRSGRGRDPHPRGSRSGRQHHRRRDLRRKPRRHHPRFGGGDRRRHQCRELNAPGRRSPQTMSAPAAAPESRAPACSRTAFATGCRKRNRREQHETRIAELAQRLKADNARIAERVAETRRADERQRSSGRSGPSRVAADASRRAAAPADPGPVGAPVSRSRAVAIDQVATAAVAAALRRRAARRSRSGPCRRSRACSPSRSSASRCTQPPSRHRRRSSSRRSRNGPPSRTPRMPTFEELPVPGQNEFRARRGEMTDADHPEKRRLTLLQRLAAVGLGRREDEPEAKGGAAIRANRAAAAVRPRSGLRPRPAPRPARAARPASRYPNMPSGAAPQGLDMHGRAAQARRMRTSEEDQLDIPAFLRRQAT